MTTRLCLFMLFLACYSPSNGQDVPEMPQPTAEHKWLEQFVGEWETTARSLPTPGTPEMTCNGKLTNRMLGGHWLVSNIENQIEGFRMEGLQTIGYDREKKKYIGTWIDSVMDHLWTYEGSVDKTGKILTLEAEGPNMLEPGKTALYRDTYEFKSEDEIATTSQVQGPDGEWVTFMTGTAKRVKK